MSRALQISQTQQLIKIIVIPEGDGGGGGGGTPDFKWWVWSNGGKNQNSQKSLGLPTQPLKMPGPIINPPKIACLISEP